MRPSSPVLRAISTELEGEGRMTMVHLTFRRVQWDHASKTRSASSRLAMSRPLCSSLPSRCHQRRKLWKPSRFSRPNHLSRSDFLPPRIGGCSSAAMPPAAHPSRLASHTRPMTPTTNRARETLMTEAERVKWTPSMGPAEPVCSLEIDRSEAVLIMQIKPSSAPAAVVMWAARQRYPSSPQPPRSGPPPSSSRHSNMPRMLELLAPFRPRARPAWASGVRRLGESAARWRTRSTSRCKLQAVT